jgi:transposase
MITGKGVKPIAAFQQKYHTLYLYGAVEPQTGDQFFFSFSHLDSICFQVFIDQFCERFPDTFNSVLLDRGSFHRAKDLVLPRNMHLIFQPAATPEVNPIERVWQYIKDRLALKNFDALDELFNAVSTILKDITQEILQSLTGFDYFITAVKSMFI